jgi:hypothetical protein
MTIEGESSAVREEASLEDDDVEDETYVPSPRAQPHGREKGIASGSGGGVGLQKLKTKVVVMRVKRWKKYLILKRSTLHHMLT